MTKPFQNFSGMAKPDKFCSERIAWLIDGFEIEKNPTKISDLKLYATLLELLWQVGQRMFTL